VVRAIATCPIPIVTGIGHERDETLADLAADVCAHTPTAAAERVVPALVDMWLAH
jgi:exodeoxyribonuclease VII large subunit